MTSQAVHATPTHPVPVPLARRGTWADRPLELLRCGIPLTLLMDLADPTGPLSAQIYEQECGCTDLDEAGRPSRT